MSEPEQPQTHAQQPGPFPAAYVPVVDPARTTRPNPAGHALVFVVATTGFVVNLVGGLGFPSHAPAEWLVNAGIGLALFATMLVAGVGLAASIRGGLVRPSRVLPWLALGMSLAGFVVWVSSSTGLWETLFLDGRGRYLSDVGGALLTAPIWAIAPVLAGFALRRRGGIAPTLASWAAIALWVVLVAGVAASALLYSARLTD